jgi:outer membrane lipoprotein-sorting protein
MKPGTAISIVLLPLLSLLTLLRAQQGAPPTLESVLKKMDTAAADFRTAQAEFEWDRYERVIDEVDDVQTGTIYFRRAGKSEIEMKADVKTDGPSKDQLKSEPKEVLYSGGKIQVFQPSANIVNSYDAGNNRADIESYVALGFGGSGQELVKSFDVKYLGPETIGSIATAKLELVPRSAKMKNNLARILLWIDLQRGISVQQQLFEAQGDYKLVKYTSIREREKISDDVFKLKTNGKTQFNSPKG